jgi:hypothetical protein
MNFNFFPNENMYFNCGSYVFQLIGTLVRNARIVFVYYKPDIVKNPIGSTGSRRFGAPQDVTVLCHQLFCGLETMQTAILCTAACC